eukprot:1732342-Amphidinium_carterae.1
MRKTQQEGDQHAKDRPRRAGMAESANAQNARMFGVAPACDCRFALMSQQKLSHTLRDICNSIGMVFPDRERERETERDREKKAETDARYTFSFAQSNHHDALRFKKVVAAPPGMYPPGAYTPPTGSYPPGRMSPYGTMPPGSIPPNSAQYGTVGPRPPGPQPQPLCTKEDCYLCTKQLPTQAEAAA